MSKRKYTGLIGWDVGVNTTGAAWIKFVPKQDGSIGYMRKEARLYSGNFYKTQFDIFGSNAIDWRNCIHVLEEPKNAFGGLTMMTEAIKERDFSKGRSALTMTANIGKNIGLAQVLKQYFDILGVKYYCVSPSSRVRMTGKKGLKLRAQYGVFAGVYATMPTKANATEAQTLASTHNLQLHNTGNEHSRDAFTLVCGQTIAKARALAGISSQF